MHARWVGAILSVWCCDWSATYCDTHPDRALASSLQEEARLVFGESILTVTGCCEVCQASFKCPVAVQADGAWFGAGDM